MNAMGGALNESAQDCMGLPLPFTLAMHLLGQSKNMSLSVQGGHSTTWLSDSTTILSLDNATRLNGLGSCASVAKI